MKRLTAISHTCRLDDTDHLQCDTDSSTGCIRCAPQEIVECCDICSPNILTLLTPPPDVTTKSRASKKAHCAHYEMGPRERDFKAALSQWRSEKALDKLGETDFTEYGVILFMSDEIFHRLIDCFHYGKISTVDSIRKETRWRHDLADTYGPSLIALIRQFDPTPTLPLAQNENSREAAPLNSSSANPRNPKGGKTRCSACKQLGHNSEYLFDRP